MNLQLLRNATQMLTVNGKTILIDPMLAPKGSYDAFQNTGNSIKNPLIDLPVTESELQQLITKTDAVLLTHIHLDHWDTVAQQLLPKDITLFCQPSNVEVIRQAGFTNVTPIDNELTWNDIQIIRTGGQHGTGEIGKKMGIVSGYVIKYKQDTLYIAGDTIWCDEVQKALNQYQPTHIVLNGGGARFITGDAIVMTIDDIITVCNYAPQAKVYIVHLDAVNHGKESRADIKKALKTQDLASRCFVPTDGERFI
ncbi:MAG: L-ascorbate metabolism protein UlaG, beta-lactamase superfamily [Mucilaginibacter sp.]|nr:L-ascorbate metabolism protein UlaG, beta-lactamase superfamily [Mucilaginibacter sp.]